MLRLTFKISKIYNVFFFPNDRVWVLFSFFKEEYFNMPDSLVELNQDKCFQGKKYH